MEIGYWKIRGLGAPLRMVATYAGAEYKDQQYASGGDWFGPAKDKILAMTPLANLPYIIDGDNCVVQSNACMIYLGDKFKLNGNDEKDKLNNLVLLDEIYDLRNELMGLVYPFKLLSNDEAQYKKNAADQCEKKAPGTYKKLEGWLDKQGKKYFVCDTPCSADFHIFEMVDQHEKLAGQVGQPSIVGAFPKLKAFHEAFKAEPKLEKYFASDAYKLPCNNPIANAWFQ